MGGPLRDRVRAYATGLYRARPPRPRDLSARGGSLAHAAAGFSAMKLKIGFGVAEDVRADARACATRSARRSGSWSMPTTPTTPSTRSRSAAPSRTSTSAGSRSRSPPEDHGGYREVQGRHSRSRSPAASASSPAGASAASSPSVLVDIVQPDTCAAGGLSECKKIADMAAAFGVRYVPHVWGTGIAPRRGAAAARRAAAQPARPLRRRAAARIRPAPSTRSARRSLTEPIEQRRRHGCACRAAPASASRSTAPRWSGFALDCGTGGSRWA